jgi:hypothetical protein
MRKYLMPLTQQVYEEIGEGRVRVTNRDGRTGIFTVQGRWVEGEVRDANVNMLLFTAGPNVRSDFRYRWTLLPADVHRESGWPEPQERQLVAAAILGCPLERPIGVEPCAGHDDMRNIGEANER